MSRKNALPIARQPDPGVSPLEMPSDSSKGIILMVARTLSGDDSLTVALRLYSQEDVTSLCYTLAMLLPNSLKCLVEVEFEPRNGQVNVTVAGDVSDHDVLAASTAILGNSLEAKGRRVHLVRCSWQPDVSGVHFVLPAEIPLYADAYNDHLAGALRSRVLHVGFESVEIRRDRGFRTIILYTISQQANTRRPGHDGSFLVTLIDEVAATLAEWISNDRPDGHSPVMVGTVGGFRRR